MALYEVRVESLSKFQISFQFIKSKVVRAKLYKYAMIPVISY